MRRIIFVVTALLVIGGGIVIGLTAGHRTPPAVSSPKAGSYVALGDSVAAGVGLPSYADSSACDRTTEAYPELIAARLNYALTDVACSGATTGQGLIGQQDVNQLLVPPQITALSAGHEPQLVTMTIGANDAQWTHFIQQCYTAVCGTSADSAAVSADIAQMSQNLTTALQTIQQTYRQPPRVLLTGYYQLFAASPVASCPELSGIDSTEQAWIAQLQSSLNDAIQATARSFAFAGYVNLDFQGHALCSSDPWIQGIGAKAPYHPTADGQKAIAKAILAALPQPGGVR